MNTRLLTLTAACAVAATATTTVAVARDRGGDSAASRTPIATVTSYESRVLTLTTTGGAEVVATVSRRTRIDCRELSTDAASTTPESTTPTDERPHGDRGPGRGRGPRDDEDDDRAACDSSSLVAGTQVLGAQTTLTSKGQRFSRITLVDSGDES